MYKLAFGPKAFVVVSDPIVARHILRENAFCYDKVLFNYDLYIKKSYYLTICFLAYEMMRNVFYLCEHV